MFKNIEKKLFYSSFVLADDKYIADREILVAKEFLHNNLLQEFKNCDNVFKKVYEIPYDKGNYWELPESVLLYPRKSLIFKYNEKYGFDYNLVSLFENMPYGFDYYVVEIKGSDVFPNIPILKIFSDDKFVGLIAGCAI